MYLNRWQDLRRQCQQFACDLLSHTRSSSELAFLLNHDPSNNARRSPSTDDYQEMKLARLELAIEQKQKKVFGRNNKLYMSASEQWRNTVVVYVIFWCNDTNKCKTCPQFVAHPNIQQLLAAIWYEGLPGFRRKSAIDKVIRIDLVFFIVKCSQGYFILFI